MAAQYLLPHRIAGNIIEALAECRCSWFKNLFIKIFIKRFQISLNESVISNIDDFENFNDFFTRRLKPEARCFQPDNNACISPVDGILSDYGKIDHSTFVIAKKVNYSIHELLGSSNSWAEHFESGSYMSIYLSPKHYHRIHMPEMGKLKSMRYIPGKLYSVNDTAVEQIDKLYSKNERVICYFETKHGVMAVVFIGAFLVGSIHTSWQGRINAEKKPSGVRDWNYPNIKTKALEFNPGDEIGHFQMGSSIIILWSKEKQFNESALIYPGEIKVGESLVTST